jgi:RNA polymerase subunit RPABC4/transcription elongation factor Spt4
MNLRTFLIEYLGWCPMTPSGDTGASLRRSTRLRYNSGLPDGDLYQICPVCKKLVTEKDVVCPYCNTVLNNYTKCPFCKEEINEKETICPYCNNLLIYEYPKQVTANRNRVLFPLGFVLLFSFIAVALLQWRGIDIGTIPSLALLLLWIIGIVFFGAYIGKGDKDFWWGG